MTYNKWSMYWLKCMVQKSGQFVGLISTLLKWQIYAEQMIIVLTELQGSEFRPVCRPNCGHCWSDRCMQNKWSMYWLKCRVLNSNQILNLLWLNNRYGYNIWSLYWLKCRILNSCQFVGLISGHCWNDRCMHNNDQCIDWNEGF